jgi:hypothetical protein
MVKLFIAKLQTRNYLEGQEGFCKEGPSPGIKIT